MMKVGGDELHRRSGGYQPTVTQRGTVWTGQFEPTPDSVAVVRTLVDGHLAHLEPTCREAVVLVASELATNVVRHARTPYEVHLVVDHRVSIRVTDAGPGLPRVRHPTPEQSSGRGLLLVATIATAWGVDHADGRKVVWADVARDVSLSDRRREPERP